MLTATLLLAIQAFSVTPTDSAYLTADTLYIEPIGLRVTIPSFWMGRHPPGTTMTFPGEGRFGCQVFEQSTLDQRVITSRPSLAMLRRWKPTKMLVYKAALDSIIPDSQLVAQVGAVPYSSNCIAPQARIYITDRSTIRPSSIDRTALREIQRQYAGVTVAKSDSAGWRIVRLGWTDSKTDFVHPSTLEIWYRDVGRRSIIIAMIDAWSSRIDAAAFLSSVRCKITLCASPNTR